MSPFWRPDKHADRRGFLLARNRIQSAIRAWFEAEGFVETACAQLAHSPGIETHLHAFATEHVAENGHKRPAYLATSPEFALKKLLAAGETRIFEFARVFRNREAGSALHAPEFTMLEWYRARAEYDAVMHDCAALLALAASVAGARELKWRGKSCDPFAAPDRVTLTQAFGGAGIDLLATLDADGVGVESAMAEAAAKIGVRIGPDDAWSDLFSRVLVERIEPGLGLGRPTILCDYPAPEAALARRTAHDPRLAERFELYACGVELANGFGELTDPDEQRRRFEADAAAKLRLYGEAYPIDEDFLAALAHMPPASGVALGFDRLVMLATGAGHIADVQWTPPH
jgi:lysyl-tRNA synthetase class 2